MLKRIEGFDIDGCLVSSLHRYRLDPKTGRIDLPYWIENCTPEKIAQDTLLPLSRYYKDCLADPEVYTVIATARVCSQADFDYIEKHLGMPDKFISRKRGDKTKGATLKIKAMAYLSSLFQFRDLPGHFHEDHGEQLIAICRAFGYTGHFYPSEQGF